MFLGFVSLAGTLYADVVTRSASDVPTNSDSAPAARTYGDGGLLSGGTATGSSRDSGSISAASNAAPIVVTSAAHGLTTGTRVTITSVLGNTAANSSWVITRLTADTFSLQGSTGNGAYTSGGAWVVSGLYRLSITCSIANGFESGKSYSMLVSYQVSSVSYAQLLRFTVV